MEPPSTNRMQRKGFDGLMILLGKEQVGYAKSDCQDEYVSE